MTQASFTMWTFNIVQLHNSHAKTSWLSSHVQRSYRHAPFVLHFRPSDVLFINGIRQSTSLVMVLFDIAHCLPIDCVHVCSSCYIPGLTLFAIMPQINRCQHSWLRPETASIWDSHIYFGFSWSLYCGLPSYLIRNYWLVSILVLVQPEITSIFSIPFFSIPEIEIETRLKLENWINIETTTNQCMQSVFFCTRWIS